MSTAPPAPGRCLACGREPTWPALYFDRAACVEAWIRWHREEEPDMESGEEVRESLAGKERV